MSKRISPFDASTLSEIASIPREEARRLRKELLADLESKEAKEIGKALLEEPSKRQQFSLQVRNAAAALEKRVEALEDMLLKFEQRHGAA